MRSDIEELVTKGRRSLDAARLMLENGHYDFCASRAYYAMFYLAEAALLTLDLSYSKHSAVISAFGERFIKPGVFPRNLHESLRKAFEKRGIGDYESTPFSKEDASLLLRYAREFVDSVTAYLAKHG
ncbi:MAG: HEPN domain-containing protein [Halobacteria archaeon]